MLSKNAQYILNKLNEHGFEAYLVGGCVRDKLLNKQPEDYDVTTNALPKEIEKVFSDFHLNLKGLKHGTVGVIINGEMIEITTYRIEKEYVDFRKPREVAFTSDLIEDLARRDFTINAMAMDINENIIDVFDGKKDLKNKIIQTVNEPEQRFNEDALRIMRCLRFASIEGFKIEKSTLKYANLLAPNLKHIAYERIYTELKKMLMLPNAYNIIKETRPVFENIFPTLNIANWNELSKNIQKCNCDWMLALAILLINGETKQELERLKVESKTKKLILNLKELLNQNVKNDQAFLQKMMCVYSKEQILFLCAYLTIITDEDYNKNAKKASKGITSVNELDITGETLKNLGFKSYKIKQALNILLDAVIENKVKNQEKDLIEYAKKQA